MALGVLEGSNRYCRRYARKTKPKIVKTPRGRKSAWLTRSKPSALKLCASARNKKR